MLGTALKAFFSRARTERRYINEEIGSSSPPICPASAISHPRMAGLRGPNPTRAGAWGGSTPLAPPHVPLRSIPAPHTEGVAPLAPKPRHAKVVAASTAGVAAAGASAVPEKKKAASSPKAAPKASPASASCSSSWPCKGGHLVSGRRRRPNSGRRGLFLTLLPPPLHLQVRILQEQSGAAHQVTIQVSAARLPPGVHPELHW